MAKDPAFLFYPGDWLGGTIGMTFEQKGAYMELLMMQFTRGHMTEHMIAHVVGHHWDVLKDKFRQDSEGLWYNERLDSEKEKRKNFVDSRKNNVLGVNQYKKTGKKNNDMNGHMSSHMENRNRNEDVIKDIGVGEKFFLIIPETANSTKYRIRGTSGLKEYVEMNQSILPNPELHSKFLMTVEGDHFKDFMHLKNKFNLFVKNQYK